MTERKPLGQGFESWIERQIREAVERGEFDNLPDAGPPLNLLPFDIERLVHEWHERHPS
jgi:hypothetical protein